MAFNERGAACRRIHARLGRARDRSNNVQQPSWAFHLGLPTIVKRNPDVDRAVVVDMKVSAPLCSTPPPAHRRAPLVTGASGRRFDLTARDLGDHVGAARADPDVEVGPSTLLRKLRMPDVGELLGPSAAYVTPIGRMFARNSHDYLFSWSCSF